MNVRGGPRALRAQLPAAVERGAKVARSSARNGPPTIYEHSRAGACAPRN